VKIADHGTSFDAQRPGPPGGKTFASASTGSYAAGGCDSAISPNAFRAHKGHRWCSGSSWSQPDGIRRRGWTMAAWPRSSRTGQRSQWMTDRPRSWLITGLLLTEAPDETRGVPGRAEAAEVLVVAGFEPASWGTERPRVLRRDRSQIQTRAAAVAADDHPAVDIARHASTLRPAAVRAHR
jgi:hypothetical protein